MHSYSVKLFIAGAVLLLGLAGTAQGQCPPAGCLITQEEANVAASNAREVVALRAAVEERTKALAEKDKTIADLKLLNLQNIQDITARLNTVTADLAMEKGQRVQLEADKVFWTEILKVAIQNTRKKCAGVSLIC